MSQLLIKGACGFGLMISIAISNSIELFTNPIVHKQPTPVAYCPDIMRMDWDNYGFRHAAFSGVICSWWLILVALLLPYQPNNLHRAKLCEERRVLLEPKVYFILYIYNIITPLIMRCVQGPIPNNPYLGHTILYLLNGLGIAGISIHNNIIKLM